METVLIFRIGSLGDTVVALPCFHRVALSFPDARRTLVTDTPASLKASPIEAVLGTNGLIDDVIYFPPPPRLVGDFIALGSKIRGTGARTLIYIADRTIGATLRDLAFFRACGVERIIGAPLARDLRHLRRDPTSGDTEREAERLARCLRPLGPIDLTDDAAWDLRLQPGERRAAREALGPLNGSDFIAVNLGGKVAVKDWGDDNWGALFGLMAPSLSTLALAFFGSSDEAERAAKLAALWSGKTLNLCGRLSPRESAATMQEARIFVGHDSGPLHLAAAVGVTCVGLYGDHNMPKWWHPVGDHHHILHNMGGVRAISPDEVCRAVTAAIIGARGSSRAHPGGELLMPRAVQA